MKYISNDPDIGIIRKTKNDYFFYFRRLHGPHYCSICKNNFENGGIINKDNLYHIKCFKLYPPFLEEINKYLMILLLEK